MLLLTMIMALLMLARWDNCHWYMGVMHTVTANTAKKCATQATHATATHHYDLCFFIFGQFTNHFSRAVMFFFVQLELKLKANNIK